MLLAPLAIVSAGSFLFYGSRTLFAPPGAYLRYGMPEMRVFAGSMQLLGAAGLAIGIVVAPVGAAVAAGLTVMMVLGLAARARLNDSVRLMVPAGTLAALNAVLVYLFLSR